MPLVAVITWALLPDALTSRSIQPSKPSPLTRMSLASASRLASAGEGAYAWASPLGRTSEATSTVSPPTLRAKSARIEKVATTCTLSWAAAGPAGAVSSNVATPHAARHFASMFRSMVLFRSAVELLYYNITSAAKKNPVAEGPDLLGRVAGAGEEIEVAAEAGLGDVIDVEPGIAARRLLRRRPARSAVRKLRLIHQEVEAARSGVEADDVAVLHQRQRPTRRRFRRHMQHHRAERGAAHAGVGNPHHVLDATAAQFLGDRQGAGFRHARRADRAGIAQHQNMLRRDRQGRVIDARAEVIERVEHQRRALVRGQFPGRGRQLEGGAVRRQRAGQDGDGLALDHRSLARPDHLVVHIGRPEIDDLSQRLAAHARRREIELVLQPAPQRRYAAGSM